MSWTKLDPKKNYQLRERLNDYFHLNPENTYRRASYPQIESKACFVWFAAMFFRCYAISSYNIAYVIYMPLSVWRCFHVDLSWSLIRVPFQFSVSFVPFLRPKLICRLHFFPRVPASRLICFEDPTRVMCPEIQKHTSYLSLSHTSYLSLSITIETDVLALQAWLRVRYIHA